MSDLERIVPAEAIPMDLPTEAIPMDFSKARAIPRGSPSKPRRKRVRTRRPTEAAARKTK
jgi:hypothetical protein